MMNRPTWCFLASGLLGMAGLVAAAQVAVPQSPEPTPAFPGQTDAPPPAKASPKLKVETLATGLRSAWSLAFLPDGRFLITQGGLGPMRIVGRDGKLGEPIEGLPVIKQVGAQGLHDVVLDPDFARNRTLYFTYFAPLPGEPGGAFPIEHLYDNVWSVPLAQRRVMKIGIERVARAKLSADEK